MILLPIKGLQSIGNNVNVFQITATPLNFSFRPIDYPCKIVITNTGQEVILITFSNYAQSVISYNDRQMFILDPTVTTYQPNTDIQCTLLAYATQTVVPFIWIEQYRPTEPVTNRYLSTGAIV